MLAKRTTKLTPIISLLLGLFLGFLAGKMTIGEKTKDTAVGEAPIRTVEITIDESQREELLAQLRKFADEWGYAIRIAPPVQNKDDFIIQMWREDINKNNYSNFF